MQPGEVIVSKSPAQLEDYSDVEDQPQQADKEETSVC